MLQTVDKHLDSDFGITWETIKLTAEELYGPNPKQRWHGRIDVYVENYDRDAALEHFTQLAEHIERDAVNSTTRATFDPASLHPGDDDETPSE